MTLSLWKNPEAPLATLREEIDRLFDDFFGGRAALARVPWTEREFMPATDVRETDEALIVETELPGMKPADVTIELTPDNCLMIRGERKQEKEEKTKTTHRSERYYGRFERQIPLPQTCDTERIDAAFKDGMLNITVPKRPGAKPRTVQVKVK